MMSSTVRSTRVDVILQPGIGSFQYNWHLTRHRPSEVGVISSQEQVVQSGCDHKSTTCHVSPNNYVISKGGKLFNCVNSDSVMNKDRSLRAMLLPREFCQVICIFCTRSKTGDAKFKLKSR